MSETLRSRRWTLDRTSPWAVRKGGFLLLGVVLALVGPPGMALGEDLEIEFARRLVARGPAFYDLARLVAQRVEDDRSKSETVRGSACFLLANILRAEAQHMGDDEELLKKFEAQMAKAKRLYPNHVGSKGADFDILRSKVEQAKNLVPRAKATGDPEKVQAARAEALEIFAAAITSFAEMLQRFEKMIDTSPDDGDLRYKRDQAVLIDADTHFAFATNVYEKGVSERTALLEQALQKYDHIIDERFEFTNLLAYGYMGKGKTLFELGRLEEAAVQFEDLTFYEAGLDPTDAQFKKEIQKLENDVRLEAFYMGIRTRTTAGEMDAALQSVAELFGSWLATVEGMKRGEVSPDETPKEIRSWVRAFLPSQVAEQALKMADDAAASRKSGERDPMGGRSIRGVRTLHHGIMALLESGRASVVAGDHDRGAGLLMMVIDDSKRRGPKVPGTEFNLYGYTACKVLSETLDGGGDGGGVFFPADAAFYAGQGYFFRSEIDKALRAYRMAMDSGARSCEKVYPGRALMEMGGLLYDKKKLPLEAGFAFRTLALRYPNHKEAGKAARLAEKAFNEVVGEDGWVRRYREEARSLVQRSGQGIAPERHRFENAQRLAKAEKHLEAAKEFLRVRESVPGQEPGEMIRVPFFLMARVKAGESFFRAYGEGVKGGEPEKTHLDESRKVLGEALARTAEDRDLKARTMAIYTLGGQVLASVEVADFAQAAEVLSILDKEPDLEKEDIAKGWGFCASSRERQVVALTRLDRLDEAEAAYRALLEHLEASEEGSKQEKVAELALFQAAYELAGALEEKEKADPEGGWLKKAAPYALRVADLLPPMPARKRFLTLDWAGHLVYTGEEWEGAARVYGRLFESYEEGWRDKVLLKDGRTVEGEILEENQEGVKILTGEKVESYEKILIDRVQRRISKEIQQAADSARIFLGEAYLELDKGEKAFLLFDFLHRRPRYAGAYRILRGLAWAQFKRYEKTKDDRYLSAMGGARDLFQRLWKKLEGAGAEKYEDFRRPNDPPYERKIWEVLERILICIHEEGKFDAKAYQEVVDQIDQLSKFRGLDEKDFVFPDVKERLMKLQEDARKRAR